MTKTLAVEKRLKSLKTEQDARTRDEARLERLRQDERLRRQAVNDVALEEARKAELRGERAEAQARASDPTVMLTYRGLLIQMKDVVAHDTTVRQTACHALSLILNRLRVENDKVVFGARVKASKGIDSATPPLSLDMLKRLIEDDCRYAIKNGSLTVTVMAK